MMDYKKAYYSLIERLKEAKEDDVLCDERYCCVIDKLIKELGKYKVKYTQEVLEKHINSVTVPFKSTDWYVSKVDGKIHNIYGSSKPDLEAIKEEKANNVEPKFKIGDWIVYNRTDHSREIMQIYDIRDNRYYFTDNIHFSWSIKECDEKSHLWTIQDAKDGDVLYSPTLKLLWIFKSRDTVYCGCNLNYNDGAICGEGYFERPTDAIPATKEQVTLFFQKMKEAGCRWNSTEKKLEKIDSSKESESKGKERGISPNWSEEDEQMFDKTLYLLDAGFNNFSCTDGISECKDWLQSLKQRAVWKPSEEQMQALNEAVGIVGLFTPRGSYLKSLSEQLKKL